MNGTSAHKETERSVDVQLALTDPQRRTPCLRGKTPPLKRWNEPRL